MAERKRETIYQEVTDRIVAELEAGRVPWVQPWGAPNAEAGLGLPKNASTTKSYSGVNILILWGGVIARGFTCQNWVTFRQVKPRALQHPDRDSARWLRRRQNRTGIP